MESEYEGKHNFKINNGLCDTDVLGKPLMTDSLPLDLEVTVKEEIFDSYEAENVIYQSLPWEDSVKREEESVKYDQIPKNVPFEIDCNAVEIQEPALAENYPDNKKSYTLPKLRKPPRSRKPPSLHTPPNPVKKREKSKPKGTKTKSFQCKYCSKTFTQQSSLDDHCSIHANELPFQCRVCHHRFIESNQMKKHESVCKIRRFECYLCRFSSLNARGARFLVHFRRHTGDKPFTCKCCAKKFYSKRMLNFHMKYHPNEIQLKCSFCQRNFPSSSEAKQHESVCALKRQLECYLCKSTFTYKSSLRRHMPQHTGETSFNCKFCSKGYVRKEYLDLHMKTHAKELPYCCTICETRFAQQNDLDKHTASCRKKKLFTCELCDYSTISKIYAEDHRQKHVGSDEFKCLHCSKVFLQRSKLVHHLKIHKTQKTKFKCPNCPREFCRWLLMEKHLKNIHNNQMI